MRMATIFKVLSSSVKGTIQDNIYGNCDERFLTLGNINPTSGNRYHFSLTGEGASIDWKEGDSIMVELKMCAYKTNGQWHINHHSDTLKFIEIANINENNKLKKWIKE